MRKLMLALLLIPSVAGAQTKADSTVCVSFRVVTRPTGQIYTTSVNKVACGAVKPDTIRVTRVDTVKITRVDTVFRSPGISNIVEDPRGWNCWSLGPPAYTCIDPTKPVESQSVNTTLQAGGHTFGYIRYMRNGIITKTDPTPVIPPPAAGVPASIELGPFSKPYVPPCLTYLKPQPSSVPYATGGCIPEDSARSFMRYGIIVGGWAKDSTHAYIYSEAQKAEFLAWFANQHWPIFPKGKVDSNGMPTP